MSDYQARRETKPTPLRDVIREFIVPMRDKPPEWSGDIPWCRIEDFDGKYLHESKSKRTVSRSTIRAMNLKVFPKGTVLCSCSANLGVCAITARELVSNQTFIGLVPSPSIDTEFLYYMMSSRAEELQKLSSGTTIAYLPRSKFESFEIKIPDISRQRHIAEILSTVDEAIEHTEALIAKTQQIKTGLMHDLFTRGVSPDGRLRPPQDQAPELYKQSPLGWIPREWEVEPVGSLFVVQLGKMLSKAAKTGRFEAPYVGNRAVQWDRIDSDAIERMDFSPSEREKFRLFPGDLLVCEGGEVGRTAMWRGELDECYFQKAIHRLRPRHGRLIGTFMLGFMRFAHDRGYLADFSSRSSIAHLTREKLCSVGIPVPNLREQEYVADRFLQLDNVFIANKIIQAKNTAVKKALLAALLSPRSSALS